MKRIFRKIFLALLYYSTIFSFLFIPNIYLQAEEDDEDIEWLDEEEEENIDSLEPEESVENTKTGKATDAKDTESSEDVDASVPEESDSAEEESASIPDELDDSNTVPDDLEAPKGLHVEEASSEPLIDSYEQSLYEIYNQFYSRKVSPEEWNNIVSGKDIYTIQSKDTLWDISQVLFGDPTYWPKLWSVNPSVTNPHLIRPSETLGFIYGTEAYPPALNVIKEGTGTPVQNVAGRGQSKKQGSPQPPDFLKGMRFEIPPSNPNKKRVPVMKHLPSSLPRLYLSQKKEMDVSNLDISFRNVSKNTDTFLRYYMSSEPVSGQGVIAKAKEYGTVFHVGQKVILEMRDSVNPGQRLVVVKNKGKLYSSVFGVRGPFGYQIEVQGELKVIGRVPDSFDLYEAEVTYFVNPIAVGSLVLDRGISGFKFDYTPTDVSGSSEAQIIGVPAPESHEKSVVSPYSFVYLNRGANSGLSVGQMYQVKANPDVRKHLTYGYDIKLGQIKIIYTEGRFSTGLVTEMSNPIRVGDYIAALNQGLSMETGYDPLEDAIEDVGKEELPPVSTEKAGEPQTEEDFDDFDDEDDVFEAFE